MPAVPADIRTVCPEADTPAAMRWRRTYPGCADQVRLVRQFTGYLLTGFPLVDDVVYAAAELAANAVRHSRSGSPGGVFTVDVHRWQSGAAIAVTDQGGPDEPALGQADELAESGRGLRAVEATAARWGWSGDMDGRTVIAVYGTP